MMAIDAAVIELEAHREQVSRMIASLRRMSRAVKETHAPLSGDPQEAIAAPVTASSVETARSLLRPAKARTGTPRTPAKRVVDRHAKARTEPSRTRLISSHDAIAAALSTEERSLQEIVSRSKLSQTAVSRHLDRLRASKAVVKRRDGQRMLYRLVTPGEGLTPRRSGSAAGTPAGSAGGPVPDRRNSDADDVVWNGTKERAGTAPPLIPPRERKP